ncbi:hypothetical protein D3C72_2173500 [compost metagenome]
MIPGKLANLVTLSFEGEEVMKPILGPDGKQESYFFPMDIMPGNPLVCGQTALLDTRTARVTPLATTDIVGWSNEPGKLLRWRSTPEGPQLDTVPAP